MRVFPSPHTRIPEVHLLSNGRYHVMVTNAGGGYSRWNDLAVTRWREDATCDGWGLFCYLRDARTGALWSTAYQPTRRPSKRFEAIFVQGRAEFRRRDDDIDSHTEIAVSPEDDVEVRRVTLINLSARARTIELTSYAEVVLAPLAADLAHPAFSNLFVQTEILADRNAILCTRRPRAPGEQPPWLFHLLTAQGTPAGEASYETDRARFIGRGRTAARPGGVRRRWRRSRTARARCSTRSSRSARAVVIQPDTSANFHVISGIAETRDAALSLIGKYRDPSFAARAFEMAWSHSQVVLRQLQATEAEAQVYDELAASVLHANPLRRAGAGSARPQPARPVRPVGLRDLGRPADRADAHRRREPDRPGPADPQGPRLLARERAGRRPGDPERGLFRVPAGAERPHHGPDRRRPGRAPRGQARRDLRPAQRTAVGGGPRAAADGGAGDRHRQRGDAGRAGRTAAPDRARGPAVLPDAPPLRRGRRRPCRRASWSFSNGLGGFTPDGREYVVTLAPGQTTPAPWVERPGQRPDRHGGLGERQRVHVGRSTPTSSGSRPGTTIRSATRAARRSTSATRRPASSGRRPRCPRAASAPTSAATASGTACSSTRSSASARSCGPTSRSTRR